MNEATGNKDEDRFTVVSACLTEVPHSDSLMLYLYPDNGTLPRSLKYDPNTDSLYDVGSQAANKDLFWIQNQVIHDAEKGFGKVSFSARSGQYVDDYTIRKSSKSSVHRPSVNTRTSRELLKDLVRIMSVGEAVLISDLFKAEEMPGDPVTGCPRRRFRDIEQWCYQDEWVRPAEIHPVHGGLVLRLGDGKELTWEPQLKQWWAHWKDEGDWYRAPEGFRGINDAGDIFLSDGNLWVGLGRVSSI